MSSFDSSRNLGNDSLGSPDGWLPTHERENQHSDGVSVGGSTIGITSTTRRLNNPSGGALTLTSAPPIADGTDGQILVVFIGSAQNVVLQDRGTLASSNLRLGATTRTLGTPDYLMLMYSSTVGDWVEIVFSNVI